MTCESCAERRRAVYDAWINGQIAEAVKQAALGAGEIVGLVKKEKGDGDAV